VGVFEGLAGLNSDTPAVNEGRGAEVIGFSGVGSTDVDYSVVTDGGTSC